MDSEQVEVIQLLDKDIDLLKKGIREERAKLPDIIKTSFSESQIADPNMLDLFVDLLQLSRQHLTAPQSRATSRDKTLQAWPVLEVVPDTRPSPLLVQCRHCGRMLRAEVFHEHVTGCQSHARTESRAEPRVVVSRTRDSSPAPRQEDSEDSATEEHVPDRTSQDLTRDMSTVARDLSPLARELVKKIGAEHSKRKRDADTDDEGPKKKRKLSNEPTLPKKEIATTVEVPPPVTQHVSVPVVDSWTAEEHDARMTVKKMLMSKNSNKSSEEHVKELLEFIKTVPPRPLVFTNDEDALYFWHQSRAQSTLPVATRTARDRRAHRLRGAGVQVSALPSREQVLSEYRYAVPNRQLKLTPQQVLLQQTVKIALLSGLLNENTAAGNKQLRSSKGRVRANNSAASTPPPSAATTPSEGKGKASETHTVLLDSEPVDEKSLMAKLLQLEPNTPAASTSTANATPAPTANNSNNVTAVSTPVPVTTAPSTAIAVPATPVTAVTPVTPVTPTPAPTKTGHVPTLLVPNSALSATLMKDMALKGKTGSGVPLTAVTLLHPTQLQGANIKMQVKGKVPPLTQPKTAPPTTGVKAAPVSVAPKQISPKPAVKQPPLLAKPVLDSTTLLTGNRVAVLPITSANTASLMRAPNTTTVAGRVVSSVPVVLTTAAKPLVAPPNAVVPPTVPAKKSAAKK